jgi:anti-sigma regulatory factor (Ser/Thr protein kinase)
LFAELDNPVYAKPMATISFALKNRLSELDVLCDHLRQFCQDCGVSKRQTFEINLALDELFTNIINHGFEDNDEHHVHITCTSQDGALKITIEDDGMPFNPTAAPHPNLKCAFKDREIGGLGIHLIRSYMDRIEYIRQGGKNVLILTKSL